MHVNACWYRDGIHSYDNIHIATAVTHQTDYLLRSYAMWTASRFIR